MRVLGNLSLSEEQRTEFRNGYKLIIIAPLQEAYPERDDKGISPFAKKRFHDNNKPFLDWFKRQISQGFLAQFTLVELDLHGAREDTDSGFRILRDLGLGAPWLTYQRPSSIADVARVFAQ